MITGSLLVLKNTNRLNYQGLGKARDIVRLVNELNQKVISGKKIFDAKICDFVTTPISVIRREIEKNGDHVYLVAHGGLVVNGRSYRPISYVWNKADKVVEKLYPDADYNRGVDIKSFGPKLNMQNVYGCYLSPRVRKVKSGWLFPDYVSSIDDYAMMYEALHNRLMRYRNMKPRCKIAIRIYEGENANEANKDYAKTENVLKKWPLKEEDYYKETL